MWLRVAVLWQAFLDTIIIKVRASFIIKFNHSSVKERREGGREGREGTVLMARNSACFVRKLEKKSCGVHAEILNMCLVKVCVVLCSDR